MPIQNPTPITTSVFNGMWITNVNISFPATDRPKGSLVAQLLPFDGQHLLANGSKVATVGDITAARKSDAELGTMIDTLETECQRLAGKPAVAEIPASGSTPAVPAQPAVPEPQKLKYLTVSAPDPSKKVVCRATFADGKKTYTINDVFDLVSKDTAFAAAFQTALAKLAALAGCAIV